MSKVFSTIPKNLPVSRKSSNFDMSYGLAATGNFGQIIPIMCQPVVPGDKFKLKSDYLIRVAPMLAPLMHRVNVFVNWFYVPDYLIWDNSWNWLIGNTDDNDVEYTPPVMHRLDSTAHNEGLWYDKSSLADYLGCPTDLNIPLALAPSSLPFRAYAEIWNWYFRNEKIQDPIEYDHGDTETEESSRLLNTLRYRNWSKDYFTAALPEPQEGQDPTLLPVSGEAEVVMNSRRPTSVGQFMERLDGTPIFSQIEDSTAWEDLEKRDAIGPNAGSVSDLGMSLYGYDEDPDSMTFDRYTRQVNINPNGTLLARLENVQTTIQDFRTANRIQAFKEALMRGGTRPNEWSQMMYNVRIDDLTINRPMYLGGGSTPLQISEVLQTSEGTSSSPQGNMSGRGVSAQTGFGFRRRFKYFGWVIGTMSVMPKASYFQGMPKKFLIRDRFDLPNPFFDNLGEDEIMNGELFVNHDDPTGTFGYIPRYAAWKFNQDEIHGDFRGNLNFWTMARNFANGQNLNSSFISTEGNIPYTPFAVTDNSQSHIWFQFYHDLRVRRKLSYYGVPKLV